MTRNHPTVAIAVGFVVAAVNTLLVVRELLRSQHGLWAFAYVRVIARVALAVRELYARDR